MRRKTADGEAVRLAAKSLWNALAPILHRAGLLVLKDRTMLLVLCDSFGRWSLACAKCDSEGMIADGSTGNKVASPWVKIRNDMWSQVVKGAACFGLSPSDIANVRALDKPAPNDGKAKFFERRA